MLFPVYEAVLCEITNATIGGGNKKSVMSYQLTTILVARLEQQAVCCILEAHSLETL